MSKPIKVGIVGLGRAGWGMHLPELSDKKEMFQIVAACDIIEERNALIREKLGCRTYGSIEELAADPEVELVDIATRSCDHYAHACIALTAGKDVVLEKPACTDYAQFKDLLERANQPGKPRLYFRQNRRFETGFAALREAVESGVLGHVFELRLYQCEYQRRDDWQTLSKYGGGQMNNWGPHLIDHALQLLGAPVAEVRANRILGAAAGDCEDHFSICITGKNGRYATVCISGADAMFPGRTYTAYGSRGTAQLQDSTLRLRYIDPAQTLPPVTADEGTPASSFGATGTFEAAAEPRWIEESRTAASEDLSEFWVHLYKNYREGVPFPILDSQVDALMQVLHKAKRSPLVVAANIE